MKRCVAGPEWDRTFVVEQRRKANGGEERRGGVRKRESEREGGNGQGRGQILPNTREILELAACQSTRSCSFVHVRAISRRLKLFFLYTLRRQRATLASYLPFRIVSTILLLLRNRFLEFPIFANWYFYYPDRNFVQDFFQLFRKK